MVAIAGLIVSGIADDVLPEKFVSPVYCAVKVCVPTKNPFVTKYATLPLTWPVARKVPPSKKLTKPVAVPLDAVCTVAVSTTVLPSVVGLGYADTVVVVEACSTVSVIFAELLPKKFVSPLYVATTTCGPAVKFGSVNCAWPFAGVTSPRSVDEVVSKNVTVPVGENGVWFPMTAVNVNGCPYGTLLTLEVSVVVVCAFATVSVIAFEVTET